MVWAEPGVRRLFERLAFAQRLGMVSARPFDDDDDVVGLADQLPAIPSAAAVALMPDTHRLFRWRPRHLSAEAFIQSGQCDIGQQRRQDPANNKLRGLGFGFDGVVCGRGGGPGEDAGPGLV